MWGVKWVESSCRRSLKPNMSQTEAQQAPASCQVDDVRDVSICVAWIGRKGSRI